MSEVPSSTPKVATCSKKSDFTTIEQTLIISIINKLPWETLETVHEQTERLLVFLN